MEDAGMPLLAHGVGAPAEERTVIQLWSGRVADGGARGPHPDVILRGMSERKWVLSGCSRKEKWGEKVCWGGTNEFSRKEKWKGKSVSGRNEWMIKERKVRGRYGGEERVERWGRSVLVWSKYMFAEKEGKRKSVSRGTQLVFKGRKEGFVGRKSVNVHIC